MKRGTWSTETDTQTGKAVKSYGEMALYEPARGACDRAFLPALRRNQPR